MTSLPAPRAKPMSAIRVLIAEDSPTSRALLVALFRGASGFEVIGEARNGAEAIEKTVQLAPDLVIMDVYMPVLDGLDATKAIMREAPTPIVMVSASASASDVSMGLSATQAGALVLLEKPHDPRSASYEGDSTRLIAMARAMSNVKVVRRWGTERVARPLDRVKTPTHSMRGEARRARLIAIATSTGGPAALHRILTDLPRDIKVPIVIVQHMAQGFIDGLAKWLSGSVGLNVVVAAEGEQLIPGTAYLGAHDRHLGVSPGGQVLFSDSTPQSGFRPSGDYLFDSCARSYGSGLIAAILTGMGNDGVAGLQTVRERGGRVIAQDERSSVVFGMAQQAILSGVVDEVIPLSAIGTRLAELVEFSQI